MTTATGVKLPGHEQYEKLRKALQAGNRSQIDKILEALVKICPKILPPPGEKQMIDDDQLNFWMNDILRLLFDWENSLTRELALRASEGILPHLERTLYMDSPEWPALKTKITHDYSTLLEQSRARNDPEWHRKWSVLVRILDKEMCQGTVIINVFLAIVESGFRSAELLVREQSFDCWKLLVEIFDKYNQINIQKRIKLIIIPLKNSKSKTEVIAKKKFEIWWFLVNKLQNQLETFADTVFQPFMYFCFGPCFNDPLCYYFDSTYQEYGAPGKVYDSIKQLSAIALIHMLGPGGNETASLLPDSPVKNGLMNFSLPAASETTIISQKLFSMKTKLIIDSCTECTMLFSQMKDKKYLELNRYVWKNLLAIADREKTVSRSEILRLINVNLMALIKLSAQRMDETIRELIYDTVQMVAQSNLLVVTVGQDSPEQLSSNYKSIMSLMLHPDLNYPEEISFVIMEHVFDLRRYTSQRGVYWDMLQKTVQFLCALDPSLFNEPKADMYRRMVTQIYCTMAVHLREQITSQRSQFEQSQSIAFGFLLLPLEYDRFLQVDKIRDVWKNIYHVIVTHSKTIRYSCTFSEIIKAMTVAKYNSNLSVILDFFLTVLESVQADFDVANPPVKTLELCKDLVRKALVYQHSLEEAAKVVQCLQQLIAKMTIKGLFVVIMPIRNIMSELIQAENSKLAGVVKSTVKDLVDRFLAPKFETELKSQPKEVKWNCKMLIGLLLELPEVSQKRFMHADLKRLSDICEGKEPAKFAKPAATQKNDEFVVIDKVWKFTPERLTEHQRDRMREKRDDIPALYNDLSQSQDSFVIKPWTPNKLVIPADERNDHDKIVVSSGADPTSMTNGDVDEKSEPQDAVGSNAVEKTKLDKENNNGNVPSSATKDKEENETAKKEALKKSRTARALDLLRIDTVEGKSLQVDKIPRTRRSGSLEPSGPGSRRKNADPRRHLTRTAGLSETRLTRRAVEKQPAEKRTEKPIPLISPGKKKSEEKMKPPPERTSPRKSLNFDNVVDKEPRAAAEASVTPPKSPAKGKLANESIEEVIESSQTVSSQSVLAKKFTPKKLKEEEKESAAAADADGSLAKTELFDTQAERELSLLNKKSPIKQKADLVQESPSKNTRRAVTQKKVSEMDTVPNTEEPNSRDTMEKDKVKAVSPSPMGKSPKKSKRTTSPAPEAPLESDIARENSADKDKRKDSLSPTPKSPKKAKRSTSPVPEPMETECSAHQSSPRKGSGKSEEDALASPNLSPVRNLDEHMEPIVRNLNRSLISSPEGADQQEREADLLNSTLNISPISEDKTPQPSTPSVANSGSAGAAASPKDPPSSGSTEKRTSSRIMEREKTSVMPSPITRRTRHSPPIMQPALITSLKSRALQMTPKSPSTPSRVELRGRGAQLINLLRSQQNEASPKPSTPVAAVPPPLQNSSTPKPAAAAQNSSTPKPAAAAVQNSSTPKLAAAVAQNSSTPKPAAASAPPPNATPNDRCLMMRKMATTAPPSAPTESPERANPPPEKEKEKDYLVFSKVLPSPQASPAASILKRKFNQDDSGDDTESPAHKRKRVSFHDPPVSLTKEYIRQEEECRSPSMINRALQMIGMSPLEKAKFLLRRKSKVDSLSELAKFTRGSEAAGTDDNKDDEEELSSSPDSLEDEFVLNTTDNMSTLHVTTDAEDDQVNDVDETSPATAADPETGKLQQSAEPAAESAQIPPAEQPPTDLPKRTSPRKLAPKAAPPAAATEEPSAKKSASPVAAAAPAPAPVVPEKPDTSIRFQTQEEILTHVISTYSLDTILERYLAAGKTLEQNKSARLLTRELSGLMTKDSKMRYAVLDELSERHSAEFLEHAVQENSSAVVCARLSITTMTEYIFEKLRKAAVDDDSTVANDDEQQQERNKVLQTMFDNLLQMQNYTDKSDAFLSMRERFLKTLVHQKSKAEFMELLEEYFATSKAKSGSAST